MSDSSLRSYAHLLETYTVEAHDLPLDANIKSVLSILHEKQKKTETVFQRTLDQALGLVISGDKPNEQTVLLINLLFVVLTYDYKDEEDRRTAQSLQDLMAAGYESRVLPLLIVSRSKWIRTPPLSKDKARIMAISVRKHLANE